MHKKSTTKISIFLISILFSLFLFSCADPNNDNTNNLDNKNNSNLYSAMIGTWVNENDNSDKIILTEENLREGVSVDVLLTHACKEPITIEDYANNTTNYENLRWLLDFCNEKSICFYEIANQVSDENGYWHSSPEYIIRYKAYKLNTENTVLSVVYGFAENGQVHPQTYIRPNNENTDNENNSSPLSASDLTGSYTISEANGSTFTFSSDGTWTYEYNSSTTNGKWTVSDGALTINYSLGGYSSSAVFTVKVSDNTYTLTGKSGDTTTIVSSAFKITDQNAIQNGVVTLVKK